MLALVNNVGASSGRAAADLASDCSVASAWSSHQWPGNFVCCGGGGLACCSGGDLACCSDLVCGGDITYCGGWGGSMRGRFMGEDEAVFWTPLGASNERLGRLEPTVLSALTVLVRLRLGGDSNGAIVAAGGAGTSGGTWPSASSVIMALLPRSPKRRWSSLHS